MAGVVPVLNINVADLQRATVGEACTALASTLTRLGGNVSVSPTS